MTDEPDDIDDAPPERPHRVATPRGFVFTTQLLTHPEPTELHIGTMHGSGWQASARSVAVLDDHMHARRAYETSAS